MTKIKDQELLEHIGRNVRKLRLEKGYSQYKLADLANINRSQVIDIEAGRINTTVSTIKVLADALEVPMSEIIDMEH